MPPGPFTVSACGNEFLCTFVIRSFTIWQNSILKTTTALKITARPTAGYHAVLDLSIRLNQQGNNVQANWKHIQGTSVTLVISFPGDVFFDNNELKVTRIVAA